LNEERFGQRFAKEVGMGDPAEENDPPPESTVLLAKHSSLSTRNLKISGDGDKCHSLVTPENIPFSRPSSNALCNQGNESLWLTLASFNA